MVWRAVKVLRCDGNKENGFNCLNESFIVKQVSADETLLICSKCGTVMAHAELNLPAGHDK